MALKEQGFKSEAIAETLLFHLYPLVSAATLLILIAMILSCLVVGELFLPFYQLSLKLTACPPTPLSHFNFLDPINVSVYSVA